MPTKFNLSFLFILLPFVVFSQDWVSMMNDPNANFFEVQAEFNRYWSEHPIEKGKGYKQFKRWEYMRKHRVDQQGKFNPSVDKIELYSKLQKENLSKGTSGHGDWKALGPFGGADGSGAGRVNAINFHPTYPNTMYAAGASGGIWISTDYGITWKTNTDQLASLGFSDFVFNPLQPDIMYAASGDRDAKDSYSIGVLKSTNGGYSWDTTGLKYTIQQQRIVNRLAINPLNPDILYAATSMGLFKTYDAGNTWKILRNGNFKDLKIKLNDTNVIFVSTASQLYRSSNAGATYTLISIATPGSFENIRIALTAADPEYVYAVGALASDHGFGGLFKSTNGGITFSTMSTSPNILGWKTNGSDAGGQGWYDLALEVSPLNKNLVFVGGVNIWRSADGGATWNINGHWTGGGGAPYVHADIHNLIFSPHDKTQIWASTDGGISKGSNNGAAWIEQNSGLAIGQIYRLGSSNTVEYKIMTGWQDNGSNILTNSTDWNRELGGDGMECIIDYTNPSIMYGSLYYGSISKTTNNGTDWSNITNDIGEQGDWVTPYILNPIKPKTMLVGLINIWKSYDRGENWLKLTNISSTETFTCLAMSKSDTNVIYATTDSKFYKSINSGLSWVVIPTNSGSGLYTSILIHPNNPNKIWISKSGFYDGQKVYSSNDGGLNWTNVSGNLPNLPANCLVYENGTPDGIYVGTDVGVYYTDTILGDWQPFINGLPNVQVNELEIYYPTKKIRAATYGRGLWESKVYSIATKISETTDEESSLKIIPNPAVQSIKIIGIAHSNNNFNIEISSADGKKIIEILDFNPQNEIDISSLNPGFYILKITSDKGVYSSKFIKLKE